MHEAFAVQVAHAARDVCRQAHARRPRQLDRRVSQHCFQAASIDVLQQTKQRTRTNNQRRH